MSEDKINEALDAIQANKNFLDKVATKFQRPHFGNGMDCVIYLSGLFAEIDADLKTLDVPANYPMLAAKLLLLQQSYELLNGSFKDEVKSDTRETMAEMWPQGLDAGYVATVVVATSVET